MLKAALGLAEARGQIPRNPASFVEVGSSRTNTADRTWWTPEEIGVFLKHAESQTDLPMAMLEVLIDTGARRGEVCGLRWSDFDEKAGTITIKRQMTVNSRTHAVALAPTKRPRSKSVIALHPMTVQRLKARRRQSREHKMAMLQTWPSEGVSADLIFTWPDGTFIHPSTVTRAVKRLTKAAGLPPGTPHGFRHSFATAALAAKVPVEVVAARLGDTPRVIQETYAHVLAADDAASALLIGDLFRAPREIHP